MSILNSHGIVESLERRQLLSATAGPLAAPGVPAAYDAPGASGAIIATLAHVKVQARSAAVSQHLLRVTVVNAVTGRPIVGVRITGYWNNGKLQGNLPTAVTNKYGVAQIAGPREPIWHLTYTAPGFKTLVNKTRFATDAVDVLTKEMFPV